MRLNRLSSGISFSATLALDSRAKELASSGVDVVSMAVGEPDFDAPRVAREAARVAVEGGSVRYTPVAGTPALRAAIARHLSATRGGTWTPNEVTVCHSAKHALASALACTVEPGDEVLLVLPAWNSYGEQVRIVGGVPVSVEPRSDCGPDIAALEAAVTERTRGIMVNSPSNPSGYVWTRAETEAFGAFCERHDLWILSDEIYRRLVFEGEPQVSPASLSDSLRARTMIVDGASKSYAMTGYRIGFVAAPPEVAAAVARLESQVTGCPNAISQAAYLAALAPEGPDADPLAEPPEVEAMCAEFNRRRRVIVDGLSALGLEVPWPRGAFYAFPNVASVLDERGSVGFCEDLLESESLAIVPGSVFGMDQHVRLSYATSMAKIEEALTRLGRFLETRRA